MDQSFKGQKLFHKIKQGSCGSCWAFAAVGAIEGQLKIKKGVSTKLSEQEVIECAKNPWTGALLGCKGGWDFAAYNHATSYNGITNLSNKPYRAVDYLGRRVLKIFHETC